MELNKEQLAAIKHGVDLTNRITAITGSAGTGKTTIMKHIHNALNTSNINLVVLCAPTGKAARRIKEATGINAVTIHKLLEYGRPGDIDAKTGKALDPTYPKRNNRNRLEQMIVLADEYAMVNTELHTNLLAALPSGGKLVAFGDINQLPPIEPYRAFDKFNKPIPSPFKQLLARKEFVCKLTEIYRQGADSNILVNANKISQGHTPVVNKNMDDWMVKLTDAPVQALKAYISWAKEEKQIDFTSLNAQIITCSKKSWVGTYTLNGMLRTLLNPDIKETVNLARHKWDAKLPVAIGVGDKVLCNENTYDLRDYFERFTDFLEDTHAPILSSFIPCPENKMVLNGEIGVVIAIDKEDGTVEIDFGDRVVEIPVTINEYHRRKDTIIKVKPQRILSLGYALTTHKCQGSEFNHVCYVINKSTKFVQSRQNFYTAVTRAKESCTVIADQQSLRYSLNMVKG